MKRERITLQQLAQEVAKELLKSSNPQQVTMEIASPLPTKLPKPSAGPPQVSVIDRAIDARSIMNQIEVSRDTIGKLRTTLRELDARHDDYFSAAYQFTNECERLSVLTQQLLEAVPG